MSDRLHQAWKHLVHRDLVTINLASESAAQFAGVCFGIWKSGRATHGNLEPGTAPGLRLDSSEWPMTDRFAMSIRFPARSC